MFVGWVADGLVVEEVAEVWFLCCWSSGSPGVQKFTVQKKASTYVPPTKNRTKRVHVGM
jgi:hypothetical protein